MAITINFDTANRPETPTFILERRNGEKFGRLNNISGIHFSDRLTPSEFSFVLHKNIDGILCKYWDDVTDFKLIYVGEWRKHFQISVSTTEDENGKLIKNVIGTPLCEAELSQLNLYDIEINTEIDIEREDYEPTVLYNPEKPNASLIDRLLSTKAEHYIIHHVDDTIQKIQRTFSFDNSSIYNAFTEIEKEIGCIFIYGEEDFRSPMMRTISIYDLESNCKDCGHRGEFTKICPECGSKNILEGYGKDTCIFINKDNIGTSITYSTDVDSVKNCFRLEAGDDLMTSTIININPAGSQYLWCLTDDMKEDMSKDLVEKLESYDKKYEHYQKDYDFNFSNDIVTEYNNLIQKYLSFRDDLEKVKSPIIGYSNLIKTYYDVIDLYGFLNTSLMPPIDTEKKNAEQQAELLKQSVMSPISLENIKYISLATANSAVVAYAKVFIDTARYKVKVKDSSIANLTWKGVLTITSYSDEEDAADTTLLSITFNDDYENFLEQSLDKALTKSEDKDFSIIGLFKLDLSAFKTELKKYSYSYLQIINDSCQTCIDILIEQGIGKDDGWTYNGEDLYNKIYLPYYNKKEAINTELGVREKELEIANGKLDEYGDVKIKGLGNYIDDYRKTVLEELNFQKYIGKDWEEFSSYRREDTWKNSNYISDGLSNSELFKNAKDFFAAAKKDIYKSANLQHTISAPLKNLLLLDDFKDIIKYFSIGNWIRVEVDGKLFKLRLIEYDIDYDNLNDLNVVFSDVYKVDVAISDVENILNQTTSMSTSYSSVKQQAEQGSQSKDWLDNWVAKGLDATVTKIVNSADNQDIVYDNHGLLFRKKDPIAKTYSPIQLKVINSTLALTTDNWKTAKVGVGQFMYWNPKTQKYEVGYGVIANQIVGNIVLSEELGIYNKSGTMTFEEEGGLTIKNNTNIFNVNPNNTQFLSLKKDTQNLLYVDTSGNLNVKGKIIADALTLGDGVSIDKDNVNGLDIYISKDGIIGSTPANGVTGFKVSSEGLLQASNAIIYGSLYSSKGTIGGWSLANGYISYKDSNNKYSGMGANGIGYAFYAGSTDVNGNNGLFRVGHDGVLNATNATISGTIDASKGNIGGFTISSNRLFAGTGVNYAGFSSGNITLFAGATDVYGNNAKFQLYSNGDLNTSGNMKIKSADFTIISPETGYSAFSVNRYGHVYLTHGLNVFTSNDTDNGEKYIAITNRNKNLKITTGSDPFDGKIYINAKDQTLQVDSDNMHVTGWLRTRDYWNNMCNVVTAPGDQAIKLQWNGSGVEVWVGDSHVKTIV